MLADNSAMSVEGFNSKLNHLMYDPHRRGLSSDHTEDALRIVQNGDEAEKFDATQAAIIWTDVFGHRQVKSQSSKEKSMRQNQTNRVRLREQYQDQVVRAEKKRKAVDRYYRKKLVLTIGRGLVQPPVRKGHKRKRDALRSSSSSSSSSVTTAEKDHEKSASGSSDQEELPPSGSDSDYEDMQPVLDSVANVLKMNSVVMQEYIANDDFDEDKMPKACEQRHFLFHDADHSLQLGRITKVYGLRSKPHRKHGLTVEVKFMNEAGKQDMQLTLRAYDSTLVAIKSWALLICTK